MELGLGTFSLRMPAIKYGMLRNASSGILTGHRYILGWLEGVFMA